MSSDYDYFYLTKIHIAGQDTAFLLNIETVQLLQPVVLESNCSPHCTGKSLSEALIFASTNPQNDDRLFIELQVQSWTSLYMDGTAVKFFLVICPHEAGTWDPNYTPGVDFLDHDFL